MALADEDAEPGSLSELYADRFAPMVRLAYLLTGSRAVAEDVVQDSFLRVQQHWDDVREPAAYLRTTVVNGCRAHHRRAGRERARYADLVAETVSAETPIVMDAVAKLPYRQRAALVLRFYEQWTEVEIAAALGCRPATVRSLVHRGLLSLRKVMEP